MNRIGITLAMASLSILMACAGGDDRGGPGGGGGIMLMDAGGGLPDAPTSPPTPTPDASTTPPSTDCSGSTPPMCCDALPPLPAELLPRCSSATLSCAVDCTTGECQQECFGRDTTPPAPLGMSSIDCADCVVIQQISCAITAGCAGQWGTYNCCLSNCLSIAGSTSEGCGMTCAPERNTFVTCANGTAMACSSQVNSCFASGM